MVRAGDLNREPTGSVSRYGRDRGLRAATAALSLLACAAPSARADAASDHLRSCAAAKDPHSCESSRGEFSKWFLLAYKGDYQGQRNVAFCLFNGCDGAVQPNATLACAWRQIITRSGSNKVDGTDQANLKLACGRLGEAELETAKAQAARLQRTIGLAGR